MITVPKIPKATKATNGKQAQAEAKKKLEHLSSFADRLQTSPSSALDHFLSHPWIASEHLPRVAGASWNVNFGGGLALHMACAYHRETLVDLMLQNGAPVNAPAPSGCNAIMIALDGIVDIRSDPTSTVNVLLRHGCRADGIDNHGAGTLYRIQSEIPIPLFRDLIDAGARVNCYDHDGSHLLGYLVTAVRMDPFVRKANVMALLDSGGVNIDHCQGWGRDSWDALRSSLESGHFDIANRLVELGADVRRPNNLGFNLLHLSKSTEMVEWLLDRAPDLIDRPAHQGQTPLFSLASAMASTPSGVKALQTYMQMLVQLVEAGTDLGRETLSHQLLSRHPDHQVQELWGSMMARHTARAAIADLTRDTTNQSTRGPAP